MSSVNISNWTPANAAEAAAEGWGVFVYESDSAPVALIQRIDDAPCLEIAPSFDSDEQAMEHVIERANNGGFVHRLALMINDTEA